MSKFTYLTTKIAAVIGVSMLTNSASILASANTSLDFQNDIELLNFSYIAFEQSTEELVLRSNKGSIDLTTKNITLVGDVEGEFSFNEKNISLKAQSLNGNLKGSSVFSEEKTQLKIDDIEIVSSSVVIDQTSEENIKIEFKNANLYKIDSSSRINKGKANKIELFPSKDLILLEGKAEFYEDNMKIISEEIHYDLKKNTVIKSINATIINS